MGVERVDYYSDEEYQQALQNEQDYWRRQEPDVVPCFKCGGQMYWESNEPSENICTRCKQDLTQKAKELTEELPNDDGKFEEKSQ